MVAGWQFGVGSTEAQFSETEVALENAFAGSGNDCFQRMVICNGHYTVYHCDEQFTSTRCGLYEQDCLFCEI